MLNGAGPKAYKEGLLLESGLGDESILTADWYIGEATSGA